MKRIKLATNSPEFSRLVYGTWRLLDTKPTAQEINRRLHACLGLGITTIDTAEIYGLYEVEQLLGAALALSPGLRDKLEALSWLRTQLHRIKHIRQHQSYIYPVCGIDGTELWYVVHGGKVMVALPAPSNDDGPRDRLRAQRE